jgi:hypothetical protein
MWLLLIAQFAIPAAMVACVGGVYLAGLAHAGSHTALVGPPPIDPKEVVPVWVHGLAMLVVALGWPYTVIIGAIGLGNLFRPSVRARRGTWLLLLAGTATCAVLLAVMFHPALDELFVWLAD